MSKGKQKPEEQCRHVYVKFENSLNYHCKYCSDKLLWGPEQEKEFLDELACDEKKTREKKIQMLNGYILALSQVPGGNFTHMEDANLMEYAMKLIIALEHAGASIVLEVG